MKIILRLAQEIMTKIKNWIFILSKAECSLTFYNNTSNQKNFDLITIAFNNDKLIKLQSALLKKFINEKYCHHVVDNSTDKNTSRKLHSFCKKNFVNYYRLPRNPSSKPSLSHGYAINWALHNIVSKSNNIYYGFLDHDIFPIKKTSMVSNLKNQAFYGHHQKRDDLSYLWPGFCFFDKRKIKPKDINFLPDSKIKVDTGGRLYKKIKEFSKTKNIWPKHSYIKINNDHGTIHDSCIEKIDNWIHLINGSEWKQTNKRLDLGINYIKKFLSS